MAPSIVQAALSLCLVGSSFAALENRYSIVLDKRAAGISSTLPTTWTYQGCYSDPGPRTLSGPSYVNSTAMTDETCIGFCSEQYYIYAGLEYSQECYCGNSTTGGAVAASTDCGMSVSFGILSYLLFLTFCSAVGIAAKSAVAPVDFQYIGMERPLQPAPLQIPVHWDSDFTDVTRRETANVPLPMV
jgi:hypothetical protein